MDTLDKHFRNLASAAFKAHGFVSADLLSHWPAIVGEVHAALATPERIKWPRPAKDGETAGGILFLKAAPGRALELEYAAALLLERINQFMGYHAIAKIKVLPGAELPLSPRPKPPVPVPLAGDLHLETIADPHLREALNRLGSAMLADPARPRSPQGE